MSHESDELVLTIVNDGDLYRQRVQPIVKNLAKKIVKGVYDKTLAVKLWKYLADDGAKKYTKEWGLKFSVADRTDAAKQLQRYFEDEVQHTARSLRK